VIVGLWAVNSDDERALRSNDSVLTFYLSDKNYTRWEVGCQVNSSGTEKGLTTNSHELTQRESRIARIPTD